MNVEDPGPTQPTSGVHERDLPIVGYKTNLFRLWSGDFVSNVGSSMATFAVPVIGVTALGLSAVEISWVVAASLSAPLFMSLSAGVVADRARRSLLLQICNAGRLVVFALLFFLLLSGNLAWIWLALGLFTVGILTLLYESAMAAAIPAIVPRGKLIQANSWIEGGVSVAETGGPALAGAIIGTFGSPVILLLNALSYAFSSLMLVGLPIDRKSQEADADEPASGLRGHLAEIRLGFTLLWRQVPQRVVLLAATIYNFFDSWLLAIFAVYALTVLNINPLILGLIFVIPTVTGLVGSGLAFRLTERFGLGKLLTASFVCIAAAGAALTLTTVTSGVAAAALTTVIFAVFEFCIVVNMILGRTMRQTLFPDRHISKVAGTARFVSWGVDPIGALVGGALAAWIGVQGSVIVASCGFAFAALVCVLSRQLRGFDRLPDGATVG